MLRSFLTFVHVFANSAPIEVQRWIGKGHRIHAESALLPYQGIQSSAGVEDRGRRAEPCHLHVACLRECPQTCQRRSAIRHGVLVRHFVHGECCSMTPVQILDTNRHDRAPLACHVALLDVAVPRIHLSSPANALLFTRMHAESTFLLHY